MVSVSEEARESVLEQIEESSKPAVETLKEIKESAEGEKATNVNLVVNNLVDEMDYFCLREAEATIRSNKSEAVKEADAVLEDTDADNLKDERDEIVEEIAEEVDYEDLSASAAPVVAEINELDELAEKLKTVNDEIENIREPYNEKAKEPRNKKGNKLNSMAAQIEVIHGRNIEVPSGISTEVGK